MLLKKAISQRWGGAYLGGRIFRGNELLIFS